MSFCKKCGTQTHSSDAFCAKCGFNLKTETAHRSSPQERPRGAGFEVKSRNAALPALQTAEGKARYEKVESMYRTRRQICYLIALALGAFAYSIGFEARNVPLLITTGILFITSLSVAVCARWKEADYYSIPGSRDINGEHRCIHCGHRGIYRQGEYKTNNEHAKCSKCKEHLWTN